MADGKFRYVSGVSFFFFFVFVFFVTIKVVSLTS